MPLHLFADAGAQSTVTGAITAAQTTITLVSASGFPGIATSGQFSVVILDSGNPGYSASSPLATPYEYQPVNNVTGNVLTFGVGGGGASRAAYAGTTPRAYFAGSTVAAVMLAEDLMSSFAWKFDEQILVGTAATIRVPAAGSIPASYLGIAFRHIQIRWKIPTTTNTTATAVSAQFNGDGGTNYIVAGLDVISGTPTSFQSSANTAFRIGAVSGTNTPGNQATGTTDINDAFSSTTFRGVTSACWRADSGGTGLEFCGGQWSNSSAPITSIVMFPNAGSFAVGTMVTTYLIP
jgi:hypothetical protein